MKIIYILGIDGSGKTTLAKNLVKHLNQQDHSFHYCYAQHIPFILKPLKIIAQKSVMKSTDEFKNYSHYTDMKKKYSLKLRKLSYIYGFIWLLDYFLMAGFKIYYHRFLNHDLIVDRYFLDIVVNISETLQLKDSQLVRFAYFVSKLFPLPSAYYFIEVPEHVAFARKNDIQSIQYLTERKQSYKKLAEIFHFNYFDGTQSPEELRQSVQSHIIMFTNS